MIVHRVVMPVTEAVSWTVLGDDGEPVAAAESYLAHLAALERSPETVRAYAFGLKAYFEFLAAHAVAWDEASVEDVGRFVAWLRAPADNVVVLDGGTARRSPATVNRYLAAVFGFFGPLSGDLVGGAPFSPALTPDVMDEPASEFRTVSAGASGPRLSTQL